MTLVKAVEKRDLSLLKRELKVQGTIVGGTVALMWALEVVDTLTFHALDKLAIVPRTWAALPRIPLAPFLHFGFGHLAVNTLPLAVLAWLIMVRKTSDLAPVAAVTTLLGGLGVWLFGRTAHHAGASILIFGFLGYLLARGVFDRKLGSIVLSALVFALYGGAIWGIFPQQGHVSWEGHLFGFAAGVLSAWRLSKRDALAARVLPSRLRA